MTTMEESIKMQAIAILIATSECPRPVKKKLYDELLNLVKVKLNADELKEYEESFKPRPNPWSFQSNSPFVQSNSPFDEPTQSSPIQARSTPMRSTLITVFRKPEDYSAEELAFGLAKDMNFKYATKRSPQALTSIIKKAKKIVESQDKTGEPRGYQS